MAIPRRLRWIFTEYPTYYITACTYRRRRILARTDVHSSFVRFALAAAKHGIHVGRYVIMPDHIHLFASFAPGSISVSIWMKSLKNAISKVLKSATFRPPHWQRGFFDHVIRSEESYSKKWLYVRENPVRAGLVQTAEEWPYAGEICMLGD